MPSSKTQLRALLPQHGSGAGQAGTVSASPLCMWAEPGDSEDVGGQTVLLDQGAEKSDTCHPPRELSAAGIALPPGGVAPLNHCAGESLNAPGVNSVKNEHNIVFR